MWMSSDLIETLESRTLMSATPVSGAVLIGKVLSISGSAESDMIIVGLTADNKSVFVQVNNSGGMTTRTFPKASVGSVVIEGGAGDDMMIVDESWGKFVPTLMIGGDGSDLLIGGSADDILVGDGGRDAAKVRAHSEALSGVA